VIDGKGNVHLAMKGYRTAELPNAIEGELLKPLKSILKR